MHVTQQLRNRPEQFETAPNWERARIKAPDLKDRPSRKFASKSCTLRTLRRGK